MQKPARVNNREVSAIPMNVVLLPPSLIENLFTTLEIFFIFLQILPITLLLFLLNSKKIIYWDIQLADKMNCTRSSSVTCLGLSQTLMMQIKVFQGPALFHATLQWLTSFHATGLFLYPLKTRENNLFSDIFWRYRKRPVAWNELNILWTILR